MQFVTAQNRATFFKDFKINSPVKQVVEYWIPDDTTKIDTLDYWERKVWNFSKDGRQIDEWYYDRNDSSTFYKIYSYEYPNDSTIIMNTYGRYRYLTYKTVFKFDKQHREKEIEELLQEGNKWIFIYNDKGKCFFRW